MTARAIPPEAAARLLHNLESFVGSVHAGLNSEDADPAQRSRWSRAAGLLDRNLASIRQAAQEADDGRQEALVAEASELRFLARRMDGYRLDFAGAALAERLESERRLTVLVAWQIYATATGSQATGL